MYLKKADLKKVANLINTIDVREAYMHRCLKEGKWVEADDSKYLRDLAIVKLTETYKIPHVLYDLSLRNLETSDKQGWREVDLKYI